MKIDNTLFDRIKTRANNCHARDFKTSNKGDLFQFQSDYYRFTMTTPNYIDKTNLITYVQSYFFKQELSIQIDYMELCPYLSPNSNPYYRPNKIEHNLTQEEVNELCHYCFHKKEEIENKWWQEHKTKQKEKELSLKEQALKRAKYI